MQKAFFRNKFLFILLLLAIGIKLISLNNHLVEVYYTYGFYPFLSKGLRILFGWLPFSFGDLLYFSAFIILSYLLVRAYKFLRRKNIQYKGFIILKSLVIGFLLIYILFQVLWGLNYSRQGIAVQLGLNVKPYSITDLAEVTSVLQQRLNGAAEEVDTLHRSQTNNNKYLFGGGVTAYKSAEINFPFLHYDHPSLKSSLYSSVAHYFGFTGYYNPFSGEAQINTMVPSFLKPFVVTHEMAHQVGYAKENEANFVAFLASHNAADPQFRYSVYYELYLYAVREVGRRDTLLYHQLQGSLHPLVKKDNRILRAYLMHTDNPVEPYITAFYDQYLKLNNQPKGMQTYNEVIAWLIAYQKKYGTEAL
ncbi:MAG: DUF3810 domain-containing protein [Chitinophagaceae bacterium]